MNLFLLPLLTLTLLQPPAAPPAGGKPPEPAAAKAENPATKPEARTDGGWVKRQQAFNQRADKGHLTGDIDVIFFGDSITQGWEGAGLDVWNKTYEPRRAVNFGISGDRTQHVLWRIQHGNLDGLAKPDGGHAPKLVVVMIGTNNTGSDSAEQIAEGIGAVVAAIVAKLPESKVLVLGVFPRGEKAADPLRAKIAQINTLAARLADGKQIEFLDIGGKFFAGSGDRTLPKEIMPDFLHLSARGYQVWADAMEPKVRELLGEGEKQPANK